MNITDRDIERLEALDRLETAVADIGEVLPPLCWAGGNLWTVARNAKTYTTTFTEAVSLVLRRNDG